MSGIIIPFKFSSWRITSTQTFPRKRGVSEPQIIDDTRTALVRLTLFSIESVTNFLLSCPHLRRTLVFLTRPADSPKLNRLIGGVTLTANRKLSDGWKPPSAIRLRI